MVHNVYQNCQGVLVVYDVGDERSFTESSRWFTELNSFAVLAEIFAF